MSRFSFPLGFDSPEQRDGFEQRFGSRYVRRPAGDLPRLSQVLNSDLQAHQSKLDAATRRHEAEHKMREALIREREARVDAWIWQVTVGSWWGAFVPLSTLFGAVPAQRLWTGLGLAALIIIACIAPTWRRLQQEQEARNVAGPVDADAGMGRVAGAPGSLFVAGDGADLGGVERHRQRWPRD